MPYGIPGGGAGGGLMGLASLAGGPWGKLGALGLSGLGLGIGIAKAPDQIGMARKRMNFLMEQMQRIPGLAAQFRNFMIQGSGGQQANLIGSSQAYTSNLKRGLIDRGMGNTALAGLVNSMGASRLGQGMADMYGGYNLAGFDQASRIVPQMAMGSMTEDDMRNRLIGAGVDMGGKMLNSWLFPRGA